VEIGKYVADLCKGNPMMLEPLLLTQARHLHKTPTPTTPTPTTTTTTARPPRQPSPSPVHSTWVWEELADLHTLRCLRTRRCMAQYGGFVGDRLFNARKCIADEAAAVLAMQQQLQSQQSQQTQQSQQQQQRGQEEQKQQQTQTQRAAVEAARRRGAKYLYHAWHKLACLTAVVDGQPPPVWMRDGSSERDHIMRVSLGGAECC
jgi:hypothetical protein